MAPRTKRGQKTHDGEILKWAKQLERKKTILVGEVETLSSLKTDERQQNLLKQGAKNLGAKFKVRIANERRGKK